MSSLPPPPIENTPQVLPFYMGQSRRYRSLLLLALFAALSYTVIDKYNIVDLDFIGSTSAGGGSNMVTVTNKKEIINNPNAVDVSKAIDNSGDPITIYRDIIHSDNDNVRELSSFTSAAEFDDACTRLPQLRVTATTSKKLPFIRNNHFHASFQLHSIIHWAMVNQNLEEVCLYLPKRHAIRYREYLNVLLPTFRFVLHPNRELFNGSLTARETIQMTTPSIWKKWLRKHPNGEPYRKFLQYLQTQNHKYECSDSDPEVLFLNRQSPDPKHRIEKGDPIHAIPKVEEIATSMNATFGVFIGGQHDLITQARKFKCARVVIGQHGADMTNMMFAIYGRLQCIIEGPKIKQQCFEVLASEMKADYHAVGAINSISQPGKEWNLDQLSESTRACIRNYKSSETTTTIGAYFL